MRSTTDMDKGTIRAEIEIEAPPEAVFDALTSPAELIQWWGTPETYLTKDWKNDLRVGGERSCTCVGADGKVSEVRGEYKIVDRPKRVEWTWEPKWDGYKRTVVRFDIEPTKSGSLLILNHSGFAPNSPACQGHADGWKRVLGWLDQHVTKGGLKA